MHLLVEAEGARALGRGMKSIGARLARAVHRAFGRGGPVLEERYHHRVLRTPREVRNALRYVLLNVKKHAAAAVSGCRSVRLGIDRASSGPWFDGWAGRITPRAGPAPVARARTWLLLSGWRRHGLIAPFEVPGPKR